LLNSGSLYPTQLLFIFAPLTSLSSYHVCFTFYTLCLLLLISLSSSSLCLLTSFHLLRCSLVYCSLSLFFSQHLSKEVNEVKVYIHISLYIHASDPYSPQTHVLRHSDYVQFLYTVSEGSCSSCLNLKVTKIIYKELFDIY